MPPSTHGPAVARGLSRLAFDAIEQLAHVVEAMRASLAASENPLALPMHFRRGTCARAGLHPGLPAAPR